MKYNVEGTMKIKGTTQTFVKEMDADSEKRAREKTLERLGSDHRLKRTQIDIKKVEEAPK